MAHIILASLYLFLPAYVANMAPVFAKRFGIFPKLTISLDGGRTLAGKPVFGPHKTVRGIVVGVIAGVLTAWIQYILLIHSPFFASYTLFPFDTYNPTVWGMLMGGGALLGDLGKSFIKRRFHIASGERWFPWDQLDMAFGAIALGWVVYPFPIDVILIIIILTPLLGVVVNFLGYVLRLKEVW